MHVPRSLIYFAIVLLAGACASASSRASADHVIIFREHAEPQCAFEVVGDVTASASIRGGRSAAEERLPLLLARRAVREGADGLMAITLSAPSSVPFSVTGGERPTAEDLPAVRWTASAQAIRFTNDGCRS